MTAYKIVWHGYDKRYEQVTHTYKMPLKNGSELYFTTIYGDFVGLENLTIDNFLSFGIDNNKGITSRDFKLFKVLITLNKLI